MGVATKLRAGLDALSLGLNKVLSWSAWVPVLLIGSFTGLWFHLQDLVMVILTIQTSVDSAATKTLQSHVRAADEKKDEVLRQRVADSAALIVEVRRQNDMILEMMAAAVRRDALAAKRDKMMLTALEARSDLLEFLGKEVASKRERTKTAAASKRKRTTNGRRTR